MTLLLHLKSLQARLLALLLLLVTLVWLAAALLTWRGASHELDELLDGHLAQSAALLVAQQAGHGGEHPDADDGDHVEDAPSLHKYAPRVAFQVFHEGQLALSSANAGSRPMSPVSDGFATVRRADGATWRVFATVGSEGDVQVYVAEQTASRQAILWAVLQAVWLPLLCALPLLALVGWWAVRNGLAPLRELSQALAQRQPQALEPVQLAQLPTEIEPVVQSLNALLQRIQSMMAAERRFTADAAHELRTPIAAIRAQAQVALGAGDDQAQRCHALNQTLAGCDLVSHLVEQLLTLSRLESAGSAAPAGRVDLSALTQRVAAELALAALARGQQLELDADAVAWIAADELLTSVLLRNLLDNALRYSPPGATVQVLIRRDGAHIVWQQDDSGAGLSAASMARLGERFFRELGSDQSGSGLGWSIVRRIASVYAVQVEVSRSVSLGGLRVCLRWPAAPEADDN